MSVIKTFPGSIPDGEFRQRSSNGSPVTSADCWHGRRFRICQGIFQQDQPGLRITTNPSMAAAPGIDLSKLTTAIHKFPARPLHAFRVVQYRCLTSLGKELHRQCVGPRPPSHAAGVAGTTTLLA
ncbi:hypothetical protein DL546_007856 [Coniochaeta pulveracea]|uniref:Uncharacterized protein n=1 Tax=Coniochaeta pulveracea TaxID=177199 RepID=A0A420YEW6_9PEZI|nr:hypothetical protein DL546_007856 [Coniochaeta pulveracea]